MVFIKTESNTMIKSFNTAECFAEWTLENYISKNNSHVAVSCVNELNGNCREIIITNEANVTVLEVKANALNEYYKALVSRMESYVYSGH